MKPYFEGWYFKHQFKELSLAFIPGVSRNKQGEWTAFIQVLEGEKAYYITYPIETFQLQRQPFRVKVGDCLFTTKGIQISIHTKELEIQGKLTYGELNPYGKPIMGFFSKFPAMECNHEIISMHHKVRGGFRYNGKSHYMFRGLGYMEKDWGTSFPSTYKWTQCLSKRQGEITSIFMAIAKIPYLGMKFTGTIACIKHENQFYCLGTYLGAKVVLQNEDLWIIKQGAYLLMVRSYPEEENGVALKSPYKGSMEGTTVETLEGKVEYRLYEKGRQVFCIRSKRGSIERVEEPLVW